MQRDKTAILLVSFGKVDQKENELDVLEEALKQTFTGVDVYQAYCSERILSRLKEKGIVRDSVSQAIERIRQKAQYEHLIVQPAFVADGSENKRVRKEILRYEDSSWKISYGKTLLERAEIQEKIAHEIAQEYCLAPQEALVLMGHGSVCSGEEYKQFQKKVHRYKGQNFLTMSEGAPYIYAVDKLQREGYQRICLAPFLMTAGHHVEEEMIRAKDSVKHRLEHEGFEVRCVRKGIAATGLIQKILISGICEFL